MTTITKIFDFLREKNLSNDEFFLLYRKLNGETKGFAYFSSTSEKLEEKKLIKITNYAPLEYELRATGRKLFDELDEFMNKASIEESKDWIQDFRLLFKGKKMGSMGDVNECRKKLTEFLAKYPEYNQEIIIKATKKYIDTEAREHYKFLQQADYFILKNGKSRLLAFCEEVNMGEEKVVTNVIDFN
jgi:hypothetical protein